MWRIPVPFGQVRLSLQILFEAVTILCLAGFVYQRVNKWWGLFLGLTLVSLFIPFYTKESFLSYYAIVIATLWYALIVLTVDKDGCQHLMDAICVIALFHVFFQIMQIVGCDPMFVDKDGLRNKAPLGLMSNLNETAALLAFCAPAFLRRGYRKGLIVIVAGLVMAKVTMGLLAALAGAMFYLCVVSRKVWLLAYIPAGAVVAVAYFVWVDMPGVERWKVWQTAYGMFKEHWLFGSGIGHWKMVVNFPIHGVRWKTAHCEYIQGLFEMGIFFPVIMFGYFADVIRRAWGHTRNLIIPLTALVVIAANCTANFCMHIAPTAMIAVTWLAILQVELNLKDRQDDETILYRARPKRKSSRLRQNRKSSSNRSRR